MRNFIKDCSGSLTTMVGLVLPVLLVSSVATVDYTRFVKAKQVAQDAIDATVLSCAENLASKGICDRDMFNQNLHAIRDGLAETPKPIVFSGKDGVYEGNAEIKLKSVIGGLSSFFGVTKPWFSSIQVAATAALEQKDPYTEALFVVDVSSSIGNALPDLRNNSANLAGALFDNGATNVSVIPFGATVRFPTGAGFERYLSTPTCEPNKRCDNPNVWNGCFAPEPFLTGAPEHSLSDSSLNWNGDKVSKKGNPFCPGPQSEAILFSRSKSNVVSRLKELTWAHGTGTDLALNWARRAIFDHFSKPFRNGTPNPPGKKVVVLFSDGLANDTGDVDGVRSDDRQKALASTEQACKLLRDDPDIDLYVIYVYGKAVNNQSTGIASMERCAGGADNLFYGNKDTDIPELFNALTQKLISSHARLTS